jgi:hypothetical protein
MRVAGQATGTRDSLMTTPSVPSEAATGTTSRRADQFYATSCALADSVENQAGFGVRATSSREKALVRFAGDFPGYELHEEMWRQDVPPRQAPVRLARVRAPDGRVALVHTVHRVSQDRAGRRGTYFSHFLVYRSLTCLEAVQAWGAPQWLWEYPAGLTKELEAFPEVPRGGLLTDATLQHFLNGKDAREAERGAAALVPQRLSSPARCRDLLRAALCGFLLAREKAGTARGRLVIRGESGLVALLLYGIARLLPWHFVEDLTFSTYEPPGQTLREFRDGLVVGTYLPDDAPLDRDLFTSLGYALDAVQNPRSEELNKHPILPQLGRLVTLAALGEWDRLAAIQRLWVWERDLSLATFQSAVDLEPAYTNLRTGPAEKADLLTLSEGEPEQGPGWGALKDCKDNVLEYVTRHWEQEPVIKERFARWLETHRRELLTQAEDALAAGKIDAWLERWQKVVKLAQKNAGKDFLGLLDRARARAKRQPLPFPARRKLLLAWVEVEDGQFIPHKHEDLLAADSPEELKLLTTELPALWAAQGLRNCLLGEAEFRGKALDLLRGADASLLRAFIQSLQGAPAGAERTLEDLLSPGKGGPPLYDCLLPHLKLSPEQRERLLVSVRADQGAWLDYWRKEGKLIELLGALPEESPFSARLWGAYCKQLDEDLLLGNDARQLKLLQQLLAVTMKSEKVPRQVKDRLNDWYTLWKLLHNPALFRKGIPGPDRLREACERLGLGPPRALLDRCFAGKFEGPSMPPQVFDRITAAVGGFYAGDEEGLFGVLLDLAEQRNTDETKLDYHNRFLGLISDDNRLRLMLKNLKRLSLDGPSLVKLLDEMNVRFRRQLRNLWIGFVLALLAAGAGGYLLAVLRPWQTYPWPWLPW